MEQYSFRIQRIWKFFKHNIGIIKFFRKHPMILTITYVVSFYINVTKIREISQWESTTFFIIFNLIFIYLVLKDKLDIFIKEKGTTKFIVLTLFMCLFSLHSLLLSHAFTKEGKFYNDTSKQYSWFSSILRLNPCKGNGILYHNFVTNNPFIKDVVYIDKKISFEKTFQNENNQIIKGITLVVSIKYDFSDGVKLKDLDIIKSFVQNNVLSKNNFTNTVYSEIPGMTKILIPRKKAYTYDPDNIDLREGIQAFLNKNISDKKIEIQITDVEIEILRNP